jgi:predicted phage-related endonuclease
LSLICKDNGWTEYRRKDEYIRWPAMRMGSSFDFEVTHGGKMPLLEIKNVDSLAYKDGWTVEGDSVEAPAHIELQAQQELAVADREVIYIGALVGGNRVVLIKRERDEHVIGALLSRVKQFWDSIDNNIEPEPDFQKDAKFIARLYNYSDPTKVLDATGNELLAKLAANYKKAGDIVKEVQAEKDGYKAQMLTLIGDAAKVVAPWGSISAGLIGPKHIEYEREGYRDFRVFEKKAK